jgi:hypothetical protein
MGGLEDRRMFGIRTSTLLHSVGWGLYPTNSSVPSTGIWPFVLKIGISEI